MKKKYLLIAALLSSSMIFSGCNKKEKIYSSDQCNGIKIAAKKHNPDTGKDYSVYYCIESNGEAKRIGKFQPDKSAIIDEISIGSFRDINSQKNKLGDKVEIEKYGKGRIPANKIYKDIVKAVIDKTKNDIYSIKIIKSKGNYYVSVGLDANWLDIVRFYKYNEKSKQLNLLHEFREVSINGIS